MDTVIDPGCHAVLKFRVSAREKPRLLLLPLSFPSLDHNKPADPALLDPPPAADRAASPTESEKWQSCAYQQGFPNVIKGSRTMSIHTYALFVKNLFGSAT